MYYLFNKNDVTCNSQDIVQGL